MCVCVCVCVCVYELRKADMRFTPSQKFPSVALIYMFKNIWGYFKVWAGSSGWHWKWYCSVSSYLMKYKLCMTWKHGLDLACKVVLDCNVQLKEVYLNEALLCLVMKLSMERCLVTGNIVRSQVLRKCKTGCIWLGFCMTKCNIYFI